jgi:hypothetical protein
MEAPALTADAVATLLRGCDTRAATLEALEAHPKPIPTPLSIAAAPALGELLAASSSEVGREQFDRIGLLLGRLMTEASDDPAPVVGAAFGDGRLAAASDAQDNVLVCSLRKPAAELTLEDAHSYACYYATFGPASARGWTKGAAAAGLTGKQWMNLLLGEGSPTSQSK